MFLSADLICCVSLLCLCLVSREKLLLLLRLLLVRILSPAVGAEGAEGSCNVSVEGSCDVSVEDTCSRMNCALTEKACFTSARSRFRPAHLPVQYGVW
jgi:hypothetical protein